MLFPFYVFLFVFYKYMMMMMKKNLGIWRKYYSVRQTHTHTYTHTYVSHKQQSFTSSIHLTMVVNSVRETFLFYFYKCTHTHTHRLQKTGDRIKWRQYNRINALSSYMPRVCQCLVFHIFNQGSRRGGRNVLIRPL